jgi:hypothetical protein
MNTMHNRQARSATWARLAGATRPAVNLFYCTGLAVGLALALASQAEAAAKQMQITFGGYTNRSEVLTNFPVLVVLSNNVGQSFTFDDFVTTNGADLRFYTSSDGTGDGLNYEIESWNTNAGQACYVWVQVPTIPSNGTGSIYSKWGDSANSNQLACTTNGAVWTNGYVAVWHLPNGTALSAGDATSNRNNGTISPSGATAVTGVIDGAARFDGANGLVTIADSDSLDITNRFAISVWFKPNVLTQTSRYILSKLKTGGGDNAYSVVWEYANNQVEFYSGAYSGSNPRTGSGMTIGDTNWHHVVYSYDGATWCGYLDGTTKFSTPQVFSVSSSTASMYLSTFSGSGNNIDGQLDEVRVENTARSSNWVWACYQNQASNTVFNNWFFRE